MSDVACLPLPSGYTLNTYVKRVQIADAVGFIQLVREEDQRIYWVTNLDGSYKHCHLGNLSIDEETAVNEATERLDSWLIGEAIENIRWAHNSYRTWGRVI